MKFIKFSEIREISVLVKISKLIMDISRSLLLILRTDQIMQFSWMDVGHTF